MSESARIVSDAFMEGAREIHNLRTEITHLKSALEKCRVALDELVIQRSSLDDRLHTSEQRVKELVGACRVFMISFESLAGYANSITYVKGAVDEGVEMVAIPKSWGDTLQKYVSRASESLATLHKAIGDVK